MFISYCICLSQWLRDVVLLVVILGLWVYVDVIWGK